MRYDVIVIGAGPAGLSAAITLKIRNKSVLVIGNDEVSHKVSKAHEIKNYLGLPSIKGEDLAKAFIRHAEELEVEVQNHQIYTVYAMGKYFSLQTTKNEVLEAKSVVIATGVSFGKPYPGENEYLGRGVSYCATCDAPLYKGKKVVIIGGNEAQETEANYLAELCSEVIYIPTYEGEYKVESSVEVVRDVPMEFQGRMKAEKLILKEQEIEADGFFILRESVLPGQLVPGLEMDGNHISVDRKMTTNIKGLFACGDIVGPPYQYIKAAGEGNVAALSAVEYLNTLKE